MRDLYHALRLQEPFIEKLAHLTADATLRDYFEKQVRENELFMEDIIAAFSILNAEPLGRTCCTTQGLIQECNQQLEDPSAPSIRDILLVSFIRRCIYYRRGVLVSVISIAKVVGRRTDGLLSIFQSCLDRDELAESELTRVTEGSLFTKGLYRRAV